MFHKIIFGLIIRSSIIVFNSVATFHYNLDLCKIGGQMYEISLQPQNRCGLVIECQ